MVVIDVLISIVILVVIIPTIAVVDTGTTGGGNKVFIGSGAAADRSTVVYALLNNSLFISGDNYVAETATPDINSVAGSYFIFLLTYDGVLFFVAISFFRL